MRQRGFIDLRAAGLLMILLVVATCAAPPRSGVNESLNARAKDGPVTAAELVTMRRVSGLVVSADGGSAAVRIDHQEIAANRTVLAWHVVDLRTGDVRSVADGGAPLWTTNGSLQTEHAQFSDDGRWLYYRKLMNGEVQVWRARTDGRGAEQMTHDAADVVAFGLRGEQLAYSVAGATRDEILAVEAAERDAGVLLDASLMPGFPLTLGFPYNGRLATYRRVEQPRGGRSDGPLLSNRAHSVRVLDVRSRVVRPADAWTISAYVTPYREGFGRFAHAAPGRFLFEGIDKIASSDRIPNSDGSAQATLSLNPAGREIYPQPLLEWHNLDSGETRACTHAVCVETDVLALIGWAGDEIVFETSAFGMDGLHVWTPASGAVRTLKSGDVALGSHNSGANGACLLASGEAVCIAASAASPARLVAIDTASARERLLFDPNPDLNPERLGRVQVVAVTDRFGTQAIARLVLPQGASANEPLPLVLTSYTCRGFLAGGSGDDTPEHVLAGMGYAAACIDMSGTGTRASAAYDHRQESSVRSTQDLFENTVEVLAERGLIDPARVAAAGFSGSTTGLSYALTQTDRFATAMFTTNGSMDVVRCYLAASMDACGRNARARGFKPPYDVRDGYLMESPAWNAERIRTPVLMQLAEVEHREMLQLWGALRDQGRPAEMYVFPDAFHYKHLPRQRLAVYERNIDWIAFWLRGDERSAPTAPEQYVRWRLLREQQCQLFRDRSGSTPWYCGSEDPPEP